MRRASRVFPAAAWLSLLTALGCALSDKGTRSVSPLPFSVRVLSVQLPAEAPASSEDAMPLVVSGHGESFTRSLSDALEESGIFTNVVHDASDAEAADLDVYVELRGQDFGEGEILAGGAALSTFAWLFTGPLSWFVTDRGFPDSTMVMDVSVRAARPAASAGEAGAAILEDRLLLKGLELDFLERASTASIILTIIVPPWAHGSAREVAGASLAEQSVELFGQREPEQLVTRFPALYYQRFASFLVLDADRREAVVLSSRGVEQITVEDSFGVRRTLNPDDSARCEVVEPRAKEEVWQRVADRAVGIGSVSRCYRVRLEGTSPGLVRISAVLDGGLEAGPWTLRLAPPPP